MNQNDFAKYLMHAISIELPCTPSIVQMYHGLAKLGLIQGAQGELLRSRCVCRVASVVHRKMSRIYLNILSS